jgi:hypothetical protein
MAEFTNIWFLELIFTDKICTASYTKCTCPVLNALRADTCFSPRVDTRNKNGVFVPRAFNRAGGCLTSRKVVWADSTSNGYNLSSKIFL